MSDLKLKKIKPGRHSLTNLKEQSRYRWKEILSQHGISTEFLVKKNSACPRCGGKDRWRWDNKDGHGGGYCHQCDMKGDGLNLLRVWLGLTSKKDFPKLLEAVASSLSCQSSFRNIHPPKNKSEFKCRMANKIWDEAALLGATFNCLGRAYLRSRGLELNSIESLRVSDSLPYYEEGSLRSNYPALVSKVTDIHGAFLGIQRIYLTNSGQKAPVSQVKMALGNLKGGAVKFEGNEDALNVAEGVETALAVWAATKSETWAALSASNLAQLSIPASFTRVNIWADLDSNNVGLVSAKKLAESLSQKAISTRIYLPPVEIGHRKSIDWLDIYNFNKGYLFKEEK